MAAGVKRDRVGGPLVALALLAGLCWSGDARAGGGPPPDRPTVERLFQWPLGAEELQATRGGLLPGSAITSQQPRIAVIIWDDFKHPRSSRPPGSGHADGANLRRLD